MPPDFFQRYIRRRSKEALLDRYICEYFINEKRNK